MSQAAPAAPFAPQFLTTHATATAISHTGPLPAPETLKAYDTVHPGLAERIVRMAEDEATHRRALETRVVEAQVKEVEAVREQIKRGQTFGLTVCLTAIVVGGVVAALGYQLAGGIIGAGGLASLVTAFIIGRRPLPEPPKQEESAKRQTKEPSE